MDGQREMADNIEEENGETESGSGFLNCVNFTWNSWYGGRTKTSGKDRWEVAYKEITDMVYLGCGAQGVVWKGKLRGEIIAVKKLNDSKELDIKHLRHLKHDNIVRFHGICSQSPDFCLIMEYCQYGSLFDFMQSGVSIVPKQIQTWSKEIAEGMAYLHEHNIIHRDLKSPNILIGDGLVTKLSDFGTSRQWDKKSAKMTFIGTAAWMAPEVILYETCSDRIDVWSYGVVLWELLTLERPYGSMEMNAVIFGVGSYTLSLPLPASFPNKMRNLMTQCWDRIPRNRPNFKTIISHLVPATDELFNLYTENYTDIQQVWRDEVKLAMMNIRQTTPDPSMDDNPTRREQLLQVRELRDKYQENMKRANNIYMDACSVRLELEEREKFFQEFARDQACVCLTMQRTMGFPHYDSSTTPTPPKKPAELPRPKPRCMAELFSEIKKNGAVVSKSRNPPVEMDEGPFAKMGGPRHIPGFL